MESFKEFCEGWIGGMNGSKPRQRNELFNEESLKQQYEQISKAQECNKKRAQEWEESKLKEIRTIAHKMKAFIDSIKSQNLHFH